MIQIRSNQHRWFRVTAYGGVSPVVVFIGKKQYFLDLYQTWVTYQDLPLSDKIRVWRYFDMPDELGELFRIAAKVRAGDSTAVFNAIFDWMLNHLDELPPRVKQILLEVTEDQESTQQ